jgi:hypothetical protein
LTVELRSSGTNAEADLGINQPYDFDSNLEVVKIWIEKISINNKFIYSINDSVEIYNRSNGIVWNAFIPDFVDNNIDQIQLFWDPNLSFVVESGSRGKLYSSSVGNVLTASLNQKLLSEGKQYQVILSFGDEVRLKDTLSCDHILDSNLEVKFK